jgi:uncharacterized membrane protein
VNRSAPTAFYLTGFLLAACGLFLRFHNLDRKFFWEDEAWTRVRIAGYVSSEIRAEVLSTPELRVRDLHRFQQASRSRGLLHVLIATAADPKHPPLYPVLLWSWMQLVGDSDRQARLFSALISVLALPCLYWLCRELFDQRAVALTAVALLSVSPLHVLYAQEARSYALLVVAILMSSAALLRALRVASRSAWFAYALSVTLGLYVHLLFALVVVAHGLYLLASSRGPSRAMMTASRAAFAKAAAMGLLPFLPWAVPLVVALPVMRESVGWVSTPPSGVTAVAQFLSGLSAVFLDTYGFTTEGAAASLVVTAIHVMIACLVCCSLYDLYRTGRPTAWLFIVSVAGVSLLAMVLPDLIAGGQRSGVARFLFPFYLMVELSVAYLFGRKVVSAHSGERRLYRIALGILLLGGLLTGGMGGQADYWWNKGNPYLPRIARVVGATPHAVLVSDVSGANLGKLLALSHTLPDDVSLRLVADPQTAGHAARIPAFLKRFLALPYPDARRSDALAIDAGQEAIFLMDYSQRLLERVTSGGFVVVETRIADRLWSMRRAR